MITNKTTTGRVWGVVLAATFASLVTAILHKLWPGLPIAPTLLVFICFWVGFYLAGIWMLVERPAELDKKFPISSKELRRKRKEFYDWVDSLGRR